jgi:RimJ/RimL family protein N-acetyltransferase
MIELPADRYGDVKGLFSPDFPNSTMLFSALDDHTPGRVYVDRRHSPTWAIVVCHFGGTFVGGAIDQSTLNKGIAALHSQQWIALVWPPEDPPGLTLPPGAARVIDRREFLDRRPAAGGAERSDRPLPQGMSFRRIDAPLLERCLWRDEMIEFYGTTDRFLMDGLGFCLMDGEEILSEAYAAFRGANRFEIGAITPEPHRGKGYAYLTCDHLAKTIEAQGIPTYWSCGRHNVASAATARRLGYRVERPYRWVHYERCWSDDPPNGHHVHLPNVEVWPSHKRGGAGRIAELAPEGQVFRGQVMLQR